MDSPFPAGDAAQQWLALAALARLLLRLLTWAALLGIAAALAKAVVLELIFLARTPGEAAIKRLETDLRRNPPSIGFDPKETGLVLAGGGGKGAYQVGALMALQQFGTGRYAAVAGTSVGALNGVLAAQRQIGKAEAIWAEMRPSRVLSLPWLTLPLALALRVLLAPYLVARGSTSAWNNAMESASPTKLIARLAKLLIGAAPLLLILGFIYYAAGLDRGLAIAILQPLILPAIALWLGIVFLTMHSFHRAVATKLSILSSEPLRELIARNVDAALLRAQATPTYVTHATLKRSPDFVGFQPVYHNLLDIDSDGLPAFVLQSAALPEIFPQRRIANEDVVDGGLADNVPWSPLARRADLKNLIVIYLQKAQPAQALVEREVIDVLARAERVASVESPPPDLYEQIARLGDAPAKPANAPAPSASVETFADAMRRDGLYAGRTAIPPDVISGSRSIGSLLSGATKDAATPLTSIASLISAPNQPEQGSYRFGPLERALVIQPSVNPGDLISGTMNFFGYKARRLMRLGYYDALTALQTGPIDLKEAIRKAADWREDLRKPLSQRPPRDPNKPGSDFEVA